MTSSKNSSVDTEEERTRASQFMQGESPGQIGLEVSGKSPPWEGRPTCEQDLQRARYQSGRRTPRNGKCGEKVQRDQ